MGLTTVDVPTPGGSADAYLVRPDGDGPYPGVLFLMDAFGLRPRIAEMATRIAARGYVVLVPNLFHRAGRTPVFDLSGLGDDEGRGRIFQQALPLIKALDGTISGDSRAYLDHLDAQPGVTAGPDAVVGYCMGGRNALRVATAHPDRIAVLASYHAGGVVTDAPDSPHLGVGTLRGEAYFAHADNDRSMGPDQIKALEAALAEAGVRHTSEVYEGAPHGFTMSDTPMYHERGERRHWASLFAVLDRNLRTPA